MSFSIQASRGAFELEVAFASTERVVAVAGPSGAGKTTLLHGLAGLVPVREARLEIDGHVLLDSDTGVLPPPHRRRIGLVFQDTRLFAHLSVTDNVAFGRRFAARPMKTGDALALVDLDGFEKRWPASLSGGEARRVAIARALCMDPRILFLDEPFAGLDDARRGALLPYLGRLRDELGLPMLLVSHDRRDVDALAGDTVRIARGRRV